MDISRRTDYACRILRAAYNHQDSYISITAVSDEENIPYAFARSIQHDLTKAGYLKTARGAHGGLRLNCDLHQISLLNLIEALQGPTTISACASQEGVCPKQSFCVFNRAFQGANALIIAYFESIKIADLFELGEDHPSVARARMCTEHHLSETLDFFDQVNIMSQKDYAPCAS